MARDILKPARKALERLCVVGLRITFDPEGAADDGTGFDYGNGAVVHPLNDTEFVYDERTLGAGGRSLAHPSGLGGVGWIGPVQGIRSVGLQQVDGATNVETPYMGFIPLDAPNLMGNGAVVEVVFSQFPFSDPDLLDRQYTNKAVQSGALNPVRLFSCEQRTRQPA